MIIGIDIDEVLAELLEAYLKYHNQKYNTSAQKKDMFSYSFQEVFGGTEEETRQKVYDFFKSEHFQNIKPVKGALRTIKQLAKEHQLCIITARPHIIQKETEQWLAQHFPDCFQNITLTNQWHGSGGKEGLKSEIGKEKQIKIMIDDSLKHALDCASQGIYVLLADFDYPWNKTEKLPENIKRVHSWEEIAEEIEKNGKEHGRKW